MKIVAFGSAAITVIAMVYAFVQKGVADENTRISDQTLTMAERSKKIADSLRIQLQHCKEQAGLVQKIAELETKRADSLVSLFRKKK